MNNDWDALIVSACRTPIGSFGGALKDLSAVDLGAIVVREAVARAGVAPGEVGDVILGCVLQAGAGMNVARQAALKAGTLRTRPMDRPVYDPSKPYGGHRDAPRRAKSAPPLLQIATAPGADD